MNNTTTAKATTLVMRHTFNAPRERVYDAWITPEALRRWFMPDGTTMKDAVVDARVGGTYKIFATHEEMGEMNVYGTYKDLKRPERIQCTWTWEEDDKADEHETLLTLEFKDLGGKTEMILTHENFRSEESRDNHEHGWKSTFPNLEKYLAE